MTISVIALNINSYISTNFLKGSLHLNFKICSSILLMYSKLCIQNKLKNISHFTLPKPQMFLTFNVIFFSALGNQPPGLVETSQSKGSNSV